jgi:sugar lactone lactonase YvrE
VEGSDVARPLRIRLDLPTEGRVVFATHVNRTIERLEKDGMRTVFADRYEGKRLNSPNDPAPATRTA